MDKRKSILNVSVSMSLKIAVLLSGFIVRRYLILFCGNEVNGLNSLYLSIIGILAVAELGVGSAITFCMYRPIVDGDNQKVAALYQLFQKLYRIVGAFMLLAGLLVTPFLHLLARDYAQLGTDIYLPYLLMLISVVLTYCFSAKTSLFNAYKNNYITTAITSGGMLLQQLLQITVLFATRSFTGYLMCRIVTVLVQWTATEVVARRQYRDILRTKSRIDPDTRKEVVRNIKAMFMHKIGSLLVNTIDSLVISVFIGVVALGAYSNYTMIQTSLTGLLVLCFAPLTSVIGHFYAEAEQNAVRLRSEMFHGLNFILGAVFFLGYYAIIDDLIALVFSEELIVDKSISFVITFNGFVQFMRQSTLVFREATGTFYNDRWKPLVEGTLNLVLSIALVNTVGITGVILATIVTNLLICHIVEPYVLYRYAFNESPKHYYIENYAMIAAFAAALCVMHLCSVSLDNRWQELLLNGCISVALSSVVCGGMMLVNKPLRMSLRRLLKR